MDKTVLITGGSRGIGAATAVLAAQVGYDVAINFTANEAAAEEVAKLVRATGQRAMTVRADVSKDNDVIKMFQAIDNQLGNLRALVNNAGMVDTVCLVENMSVERVRHLFDVNVIGTFACAREAVLRMSLKHGGSGGAIVNMSSVAARLGAPNGAVDYAATKGAIDVFTKGLAIEVAAQGIRVNAVRPGLIDTDMHASQGQPDRVRELGPTVPMGRYGTANEVAASILWLLSDAASYVTSTIVDVSGGR
ncbi:SDR family oxidoreductase [Granulosicoccus antarcticus]|uniref:3-oxoacyl-[acyl-carrier-protein] reductase FabG n=1 Tax=Granulosicoccus antarcticus IMCC3135 TaxID=1192854 RepID=A0A2Z2NUU9_9GAMM|nr:SDR family oxidoreductase [Granulosicoccus antarcticus]ASJ73508.1 3-oxoacyl-[acyl-carrier-protein] reductase FabG [Granulosicoccus antarcticus IMCC3135]